MKNALVAQSGGPSPVINSSLAGVAEACFEYPNKIEKVFAARHGVEGILKEELIDLSTQDKKEIHYLKNTPAAGAIGTCRYKLSEKQEEDFNRIIDVIIAHNIGYFFYIGGNDSMDTAAKVAALAEERGVELVVTGVPKTIDNDVGDPEFKLIDHTPGYGSAARYWAYVIQNLEEENRGMCPSECVAVIQAMGRTSGFIPAAARLADPERKMPLQIYMTEAGLNLEQLAEKVNNQLVKSGRCIVVVSEGFDVGSLGEARDGFGHIEYGASKTTVAQVVTNYLNEVGLKARGQATGQVPGVLQRNTSAFASVVDIEEAYLVGKRAVQIAFEDGTGFMATILRSDWENYKVYYDKAPLKEVANSVRHLPRNWIAGNRIDVTDDFIKYAKPLIGETWPEIQIENGLQRFAKIEMKLIDKKLSDYIPVTLR